jgi:polyhydroxyalkanoate synthase
MIDDPASPEAKLPDPAAWSRAMADIAERSQRLVADFLKRQQQAGKDGAAPGMAMGMTDPLHIGGAFLDMTQRLMSNPARLVEAQVSLWQDYMKLWQSSAERFLGGASKPMVEPSPGDNRFKDPAWQDSAVFDFIKQSYLLTSR